MPALNTTHDPGKELLTNDSSTHPSSWTDGVMYENDVTSGGKGNFDLLNTPLNAPEPSLDPVTGRPLLDTIDTDDLGWIIPVAIVVIVAMVGFALGCYFGIRALEVRMLGWCYRNCGCCCEPGTVGARLLGNERYANLKDEDTNRRKEGVRLKEFRERSPSYGGSRPGPQQIPAYNPFDDD